MDDKTSLVKSRLRWQLAPFVMTGLFLAPIFVAAAVVSVSGANILDGLFGIYRNTPFQAGMVQLAGILVLGSPIPPLIFVIVFAVKRKDLKMRHRLTPLYVFFGIIILIALTLFE